MLANKSLHIVRWGLLGAALFVLNACGDTWSAIDETLGANPDKYKVRVGADRQPVLSQDREILVDSSVADIAVNVPMLPVNAAWPQAGGTAANISGNLALNVDIRAAESNGVGHGDDFPTGQVPPPVLGEGLLYAMDGNGNVSAHDAQDIDRVVWRSDALELDREILGGGVAYVRGRVMAVNGAGTLVALHNQTGSELWRFDVGAPVRQPPRVAGNLVFVQTADNQQFALSVINGELLWRHRGVTETASLLAPTMPALSDNMLIVPYRTGDLVALDITKGDEMWGITLSQSLRQGMLGGFTGFAGNPVVDGNVMYLATQGGMLAALETQRGGRIWDIPFMAADGPWVAGDFLFVLSKDDKLACIKRDDGKIRWVTPLPRFVNEEDKARPYEWRGPVMAGGKLWLVSGRGKMLRVDATSGALESELDIPDGIRHTPVIANQRMYLLDSNATLHVYQ